MSAKIPAKTVPMVYGTGDKAVTVNVAEDKAGRLGAGFAKPAVRKPAAKSD